MHTHPERMTCSAVSLVRFASAVETWSRIYFCCPAEFRGRLADWTFRLFLSAALLLLLPDKFSTTPRLKTQLSVVMQEWARHRFSLFTHFSFYLIFHNGLDWRISDHIYRIGFSLLRLPGWSDLCNKGFKSLWCLDESQNKSETHFPIASLHHSLSLF